jgi:hypothetical protein
LTKINAKQLPTVEFVDYTFAIARIRTDGIFGNDRYF